MPTSFGIVDDSHTKILNIYKLEEPPSMEEAAHNSNIGSIYSYNMFLKRVIISFTNLHKFLKCQNRHFSENS